MFKTWLGQTVGKDDLTRHDKWLCMMTPRLKLLRELLQDDGVIFISCDDNEQANLKMLMDEIYGEENFISCIVCQLNPRGRTFDKYIAKTHEYILCYVKNNEENKSLNLLEKEGKTLDTYTKNDDGGIYRELELRNRNPVFNRKNRPNLYFPIYINPKTFSVSLSRNKDFSCIAYPVNSANEDGCWTWGKDKVEKNLDILIGKQVKTGLWRVFRKDYLYDNDGEISKTKSKALWIDKFINNENGKETVRELFGESPFDFPKSVDLIKKLIMLGSGTDGTILDSFAGSGTTMHAVMDLNREDGGKRTCIMVQMTEASKAEPKKNICKDITRERIKRAIDKYRYGDGFRYLKVGAAIDAETMLSGNLPTWRQFAEYVYYLCTGTHLKSKREMDEKSRFVGTFGAAAIYLVYKNDREGLSEMAVTLDSAQAMIAANPEKRLIVYAPSCFLEEFFMKENNIEFVSIPYDLFRRTKVQ